MLNELPRALARGYGMHTNWGFNPLKDEMKFQDKRIKNKE
jgi:hypothetical protein